MKRFGYFLWVLLFLGLNISQVYAQTHTGTLDALKAAVADTESTSTFTQNGLFALDASLGSIGVSGGATPSLTIYGFLYDLDGNGKAGLNVASTQSLIISNAGSLNTNGTVNTSWHGFSATNGGIINNQGTLSITNSVFSDNLASLGGVLYNNTATDTISTISGSTFNNSNSGSFAGAIYNNNGILQISNTDFNNNYSSYQGGAIYNKNNAVLQISNDSNFTGNGLDNSSVTTIFGGAITSDSGATSTIEDSHFTGNAVVYTGGAIYVENGTMQISRSSFNDNYTTSGYGGALAGGDGATLKIDHSTFYNNYSDDAGAIYIYNGSLEVTNSIFSGNCNKEDTNGYGGAIYARSVSALSIDSSEFTGNGLNSDGEVVTSLGGAIHREYSSTTSTINNTTFENNAALDSGGAIANMGNDGLLQITNTDFIQNYTTSDSSSDGGGAIRHRGGLLTLSTNSTFNGNGIDGNGDVKTGYGGAIYLDSGTLEVENTKFENNAALSRGGAIRFEGGSNNLISGNTTFTGNYTYDEYSKGGAIYSSSYLTIENTTFTNNYNEGSTSSGGAIYNYSQLYINAGTSFNNNGIKLADGVETVKTYNGGAIYNSGYAVIKDTSFIGNKSSNLGGAIYNSSYLAIKASAGNTSVLFRGNEDGTGDNAIYIDGGTLFLNAGEGGKITFDDKISTSGSGSIHINSSGGDSNLTSGTIDFNAGVKNAQINIYNGVSNFNSTSTYDNVQFTMNGGEQNLTNVAFLNNSSISLSNSNVVTNISRCDFIGSDYNNTSSIFQVNAGELNILNSNVSQYTTASDGGAIWASGGEVNIVNTSFKNNSATGLGGAIYNDGAIVNVLANGANVAFTNNSDSNGLNAIYLKSGTLNLNADAGSSINFNDKITSENILNNVNINSPLANSASNSGSVNFNNTVSGANINLYNGVMKLGNESYLNTNNLNLYGGTMNLVNNSIGVMNVNNLAVNGLTNVALDADLAASSIDRITSANAATGSSMLNINHINLLSDSSISNTNLIIADANVRDYIQLGVSKIDTPLYSYNLSYNAAGGSMNFANAGFTPSVIASPVSATAGTMLTQTASYNQAFSNIDAMMFMSKLDRLLMREQKKVAAAGDFVFSPLMLQENNKGLWVKQFTSFENVPLNNGPNVSNVSYGVLIGGDSEIIDLGKGYSGYLTLYTGYNGSHQNYDNVGSYQNGGMIGLTGTVYKGDFFAAFTMNTGASNGNNYVAGGVDNFTTLMAGAALKAGYNFEFKNGRFIIQPSLTTAYTFAKTFDYTTSSGLNITSNSLNAIQISPGVKFITNCKNGWQPYLGLNMVFNAMDSSRFYANNIELPQLSIAPYVEYGLGVQRKWGERFTGFGQAMLRGGGRNGLALQFGFRWAIGKAPYEKYIPQNLS